MKKSLFTGLALLCAAAGMFTGCGKKEDSGKVRIEVVQSKPEAVKIFEKMAQKFNETHDDIELKISSPNDSITILKTRFIREDYPDIIGIGGDVHYSNFLDADMLMDISDYEGLKTIKDAYIRNADALEFVPTEGSYTVPYMANAAGILYNKDIFEAHNWKIPKTWDELMALCEDMKAQNVQPFFFGFKDVWTCLAPWNAMVVDLAPTDVCAEVNKGNTTFAENYREAAEKEKALLPYGQRDPSAYSYNDACTAFARGESAMFVIGSYAAPQIRSVNPDINLDSFVFPANNDEEKNILVSGNDLQFCVMKECKNKEAAYKVLDFLLEDENVQMYVDDQSAVPCKEGDFRLPSMLDGMEDYIKEGRLTDYQDHHYPVEMSVDAMLQTLLMDEKENAVDTFLKRFDKDWVRYNRDLIQKVRDYEEKQKQ